MKNNGGIWPNNNKETPSIPHQLYIKYKEATKERHLYEKAYSSSAVIKIRIMKVLQVLPLLLLAKLKVCNAFTTLQPTTVLSSSKQSPHLQRNLLSVSPSTLFAKNIKDDIAFSESEMNAAQSQQQQRQQQQSSSNLASQRKIDSIERFARLPVWPVWNGVFIFLISRIFGKDIAAKLEDAIGGRVCPNFFQDTGKTSPFIMLVHHRHSFAIWDPLRYLQRTFFPEGFPSHPHRGFITVTYILRGGFLHRDSAGVKQTYGAEERHQGKHTQYLMTGAGLLHEEMFDIQPDNAMGVSGQELYQLWLNVPAADKLSTPFSQLLGNEETPIAVDETVETIVLAGEYQGRQSAAKLFSDLSIFHVKLLSCQSTWDYDIPKSHETALLYLRTGSVIIDGQRVGPHNTVYLESFGGRVTLSSTSDGPADFLFLSGEPLREPVAAQGSMVMNSAYEINQAYPDYQKGNMGAPWDHTLSDEEW